jgi:hypothetical protein
LASSTTLPEQVIFFGASAAEEPEQKMYDKISSPTIINRINITILLGKIRVAFKPTYFPYSSLCYATKFLA